MEKKEVKKTAEIKKEKVGVFVGASKRDILIESLRALAFCVLGVLLGTAGHLILLPERVGREPHPAVRHHRQLYRSPEGRPGR